MRTVRDSRLPRYVIIGSGIDPALDNPNLWADIRRWTLWAEGFADVSLVAVAADKLGADEVLLPRTLVASKIPARWLWRLEASWRNLWRRRTARGEARKSAQYFSAESVERRARASQ